jgi:plastocyanin
MAKPMIAKIFPCVALLLFPAQAFAGDMDLRFVDQAGKPVSDVVVTVAPAAGTPKKSFSFPWGTSMVQQNIAFNPHVLIVPVGATVSFPNKDNVRHHIYSFSKPAKFEMKLYGHDETRSYTFTTAGAVALGCNIHDQMSGFIKVVDTPYAGKSSAAGTVHLSGIPAGGATVTIWHPQMKTKDNEMTAPVQIGSSGSLAKAFTLSLRPGK